MASFFDENTYFTGPALTPPMVARAEEVLGYRLPRSYVDLLHEKNGGVPRLQCFQTSFRTSWAADHFKITAILGIGGEWGIESSPRLIAEWGYPNVGVVVGELPSAGPDTVMLDYSAGGPDAEPRVIYVDEGKDPVVVASNFAEFLSRLADCPG